MTAGLVLVHHEAPADPIFRAWLEGTYFSAIAPMMGVHRITRLRGSADSPLGQYLTVLHTDDVGHTLGATGTPEWQALAAEAVARGVSRRTIVPYERLIEVEFDRGS